jgi:ribosomal-protein-alanine acetyltransferase
MLRPATIDDLDRLDALERRAFTGDRLSRRNLRRMIANPRAVLLIDEHAGRVRGYALALFHGSRRHARVYSIAVDAADRGRGIGQALLEGVESEARARGRRSMRLELRRDNAAALSLYASRGYRRIGVRPGYYEDHADAIVMEKPLFDVPARKARRSRARGTTAAGGAGD